MIEIDGVLLPAHWVKSKVSELYEIVGGGTPSTKEERYWDGEISWISSADIYGIREIKPRRTITEAVQEQSCSLCVGETALRWVIF